MLSHQACRCAAKAAVLPTALGRGSNHCFLHRDLWGELLGQSGSPRMRCTDTEVAGAGPTGGKWVAEKVPVWISVHKSVVLDLQAQGEMRTGQIWGSEDMLVLSLSGEKGWRQENQQCRRLEGMSRNSPRS